ncbi:hypothetical protein C7M84_023256 [Penaeus vannamei]|uniref:CCHC-type domain-containing protein n=1 Tax=Penaeus vannamei TaxID=6689 RepID=A0A3R7Q1I6_PENVA|nr:hypothetical protein C7M84_023256 [Penaeus vannamei]
MEQSSDTSSTLSSPTAKTFKRGEAIVDHSAPGNLLPRPSSQTMPSMTTPAFPAFAPRNKYVKLVFQENLSNDVKIRWLSEVTKAFCLDRELADDSIDRPHKFPTYMITHYPVGVDPSRVKELPAVYTVRRFHQNGRTVNRPVVTWSLRKPPPPVVNLTIVPCLLPCESRRMKDEQPWCFKCWGIGHIARYCSSSHKCAWYTAGNATHSCPYRIPPTPTAAVASTSTGIGHLTELMSGMAVPSSLALPCFSIPPHFKRLPHRHHSQPHLTLLMLILQKLLPFVQITLLWKCDEPACCLAMHAVIPPPLLSLGKKKVNFSNQRLHIISWNAFGIRHYSKLFAHRACTYCSHPQVIFIQEAFAGGAHVGDLAPSLTGYVSYVQHARKGLITYIHSSMPHQLLQCSISVDMTFQLFEVTVRDVTSKRAALLNYIRRHHLTHWNTGGARHVRGGTLDHIVTYGLAASYVSCNSTPSIFYNHIALSLQYSLPTQISLPHQCAQISIPPKTSLAPDAPRPPLRPGSGNLMKKVYDKLQDLNVDVPAPAVVPELPPWRNPHPAVIYTPTSRSDPPLLQKQLAMVIIASNAGGPACTIFSPTMQPPVGNEWLGRRIPDSSSSTFCELNRLLYALTLWCGHRLISVLLGMTMLIASPKLLAHWAWTTRMLHPPSSAIIKSYTLPLIM